MKIISWNVNGLRSVYQKGLADFINNHTPDILAVQETKMQDNNFLEIEEIPNYGKWYRSSALKKGYSGVANLYRKNIECNLNKVAYSINDERFDSEGRFIISDLGQILLYNVYFPSGTSGEHRQSFKYEFLDAFLKHLNSLPANDKKRLVICGDFNICHKEIDIHHPKEAEKKGLTGFLPEERAWMDEFCRSGFIDCFRLLNGEKKDCYTWWSFRAGSRGKNLGWRIDYFFISKELKNKILEAKIYPQILGSDHCPIEIKLDL